MSKQEMAFPQTLRFIKDQLVQAGYSVYEDDLSFEHKKTHTFTIPKAGSAKEKASQASRVIIAEMVSNDVKKVSVFGIGDPGDGWLSISFSLALRS